MKTTARQIEVLQFISEFRAEKGFSPSTRDMMKHFGFTSTCSVVCHVRALKKRGLLVMTPYAARTMRPTTEGAALLAEAA